MQNCLLCCSAALLLIIGKRWYSRVKSRESENHFSVSLSAGITRFDLLGDFGRFNWLGNFYIVLSYNLLFAVVTTLCLVRKFTSAVREELLKALGNVFCLTSFYYDLLHLLLCINSNQ